MNYLKAFALSCIIFFQTSEKYSYGQDEVKSTFYTGYQFSMVDFVCIGIDSRYLFAEARISVNNYATFQYDAEIAAGVNFLRLENSKHFINLSAMADFNYFDIGVGMAVGSVFYPLAVKRFGIQMEAGPIMPYLGDLDLKLRGSLGITYSFGKVTTAPKKDEAFTYNPKSGVYFSALGTTVTGGINYARYFRNAEIHTGLAIGLPTGVTAGFYYHFIDREKSPHWHMYTGADISVGDLDGIIILPYVPVGIQYLSANGFTFSIDAGPLYDPDGVIGPWAGLKIGKTFFH